MIPLQKLLFCVHFFIQLVTAHKTETFFPIEDTPFQRSFTAIVFKDYPGSPLIQLQRAPDTVGRDIAYHPYPGHLKYQGRSWESGKKSARYVHWRCDTWKDMVHDISQQTGSSWFHSEHFVCFFYFYYFRAVLWESINHQNPKRGIMTAGSPEHFTADREPTGQNRTGSLFACCAMRRYLVTKIFLLWSKINYVKTHFQYRIYASRVVSDTAKHGPRLPESDQTWCGLTGLYGRRSISALGASSTAYSSPAPDVSVKTPPRRNSTHDNIST